MSAVVSPSRHASEFQVRCGVPTGLAFTVPNSVDIDAVSHGDGAALAPRSASGPATRSCCSAPGSTRRSGRSRPSRSSTASPVSSLRRCWSSWGKAASRERWRPRPSRLGISERVRIVGYQTDVPNWLAAATVWLLPTERENFSLAVLEGLAAGCAVLSTTCRGNDEVLVDRQNALTFPVGDVAGATAALRELLRDQELRSTLSRNGRSTADRLLSGEHGRRLPAGSTTGSARDLTAPGRRDRSAYADAPQLVVDDTRVQ